MGHGGVDLMQVSGFRCSLMMIHRIRMLTQISCTALNCNASAFHCILFGCIALYIEMYSLIHDFTYNCYADTD